jgi:hypothetical protein
VLKERSTLLLATVLDLCVSRVPLSVNLSGSGVDFCLGLKGSLGSLFRLRDVVFSQEHVP